MHARIKVLSEMKENDKSWKFVKNTGNRHKDAIFKNGSHVQKCSLIFFL